jgi:DeoR/GlpR family transcriptional regulator of sugar metabolism
VHGGAVPVERFGFEGRLVPRIGSRQDEKTRIAVQAATMIAGAETLYLDAGSTVQALAERLRPARGLTCPDAGVAAVKSAAVAVSRRRMLLADGAKFGVDSSYRFSHVRDLTTVITDRIAGERHIRAMRAVGVEVVVV